MLRVAVVLVEDTAVGHQGTFHPVISIKIILEGVIIIYRRFNEIVKEAEKEKGKEAEKGLPLVTQNMKQRNSSLMMTQPIIMTPKQVQTQTIMTMT